MSAARPAAKALTRITMRYVPGEDRVRLAGEWQGGGQVAIWLTLRLLQGLVPKLLSPPGATPGAIAPHRELFLGFAQQKALAAQVPVAPVAPPADAESWLAERATISRSPSVLMSSGVSGSILSRSRIGRSITSARLLPCLVSFLTMGTSYLQCITNTGAVADWHR